MINKSFKHPKDILKDASLSKEEKISLLQSLAYDEREKSVAEEENMRSYNGNSINLLDEINECLLQLGVDSTQGKHPPTKQG